MSDTTPMNRPGEISGWPKLQLVYRTDPQCIADLLPPGLTPGRNPFVYINIYCVPVLGEPEYGVSTKVEADYDGMPGYYTLGLGIDQEAAIFISQELNGQPKFPCSVKYFRFGDQVEAACTHAGYTFLEFSGRATEELPPSAEIFRGGEEYEENEWWIKVSRAVGGVEKSYDFPPHVVRVHTSNRVLHAERVDGTLVLRDSPWDPYTELLPMREQISAHLVTADQPRREIALAGPLDPIAFWPYADTISGSRWPGERGGPRRKH
ncbi:MAG TPA: acetoacetate decarboxylase family protein [Acidimicrobiales bacterium]